MVDTIKNIKQKKQRSMDIHRLYSSLRNHKSDYTLGRLAFGRLVLDKTDVPKLDFKQSSPPI